MIGIMPLTTDFAVAEQLGREDFAALKALGFRAVINNRPDGEGGEAYASAAEAKAMAEACGLEYRHLPVNGLNLTEAETVENFDRLVGSLPGPVVAYCKTGTRSAILWAFAAARHAPVEEILESAAQVGIDLSLLGPDLLEHADRFGALPDLPPVSASRPVEDRRPAG